MDRVMSFNKLVFYSFCSVELDSQIRVMKVLWRAIVYVINIQMLLLSTILLHVVANCFLGLCSD